MAVLKVKPTLNGEGGTEVKANPTLVGDEPNLEGLEVKGVKYKVSGGANLEGMYPNTILTEFINNVTSEGSVIHGEYSYIKLSKLRELINEKSDLTELVELTGESILLYLNSGYEDFGSNPGFHISMDNIKIYLEPAEVEGDYFLTQVLTFNNDQGEPVTAYTGTIATVQISGFNNWDELLNYVITNVEDAEIMLCTQDGFLGESLNSTTASIQPSFTQLLFTNEPFDASYDSRVSAKLDLEKFMTNIHYSFENQE